VRVLNKRKFKNSNIQIFEYWNNFRYMYSNSVNRIRILFSYSNIRIFEHSIQPYVYTIIIVVSDTSVQFCSARTATARRSNYRQQEQQRVAADPETRMSFLFARCRPIQPHCSAAGAGTVVWRRRCWCCCLYTHFDD